MISTPNAIFLGIFSFAEKNFKKGGEEAAKQRHEGMEVEDER
jgi:hypothetical protein